MAKKCLLWKIFDSIKVWYSCIGRYSCIEFCLKFWNYTRGNKAPVKKSAGGVASGVATSNELGKIG